MSNVQPHRRLRETDLVLLAMGFTGRRRNGVLAELGVDLTAQGLVRTDDIHRTSIDAYLRAGTSVADSQTAINSRVAGV